jgi:hypothetical protein
MTALSPLLLWLLQDEETFTLKVHLSGVKTALAASDIANGFSKIPGVIRADPKFDEGLVVVTFDAAKPLRPREFETALGKKGTIKDLVLDRMPGKASRRGATLLFTSRAGIEHVLEQSDSGGVMGAEEQLPFIEKKIDEAKPWFWISGRLRVERTVDRKTRKETETLRIDVRKAVWFSHDE